MRLKSDLKARLRDVVAYLWSCFSKPVPKSFGELLTLLLLCLLIAVVTGILLFGWLSGDTLRYPARGSAAAACVCGVCVWLLMALVHPLRCLLSVMLPTLGSAQGLKLLLSACVALTLLSAPPNMAANVGMLTHTLKCSSESVVRSLLNSSDVMNVVKGDLVAMASAYQTAASYVQSLQSFDHVTHVNVSTVTQRFGRVARGLEGEFGRAQGQLGGLRRAAHRLLAAILVLQLCWAAGRYLHSYLTALDFDNAQVTAQLRGVACARGVELPAQPRWRLSRAELRQCVSPLALVTLHLLLCAVLLALDSLVYWLVSAGAPWLLDIPDTGITLNVSYQVQVCVYTHCLVAAECCFDKLAFQREYRWRISMGAGRCQATPSRPDQGVVVLLVLLFLLGYVLAVLQVYARRLRRAAAASFFQAQEQRRTHFLLQKILAKQTAGGGATVFTIATAERVGGGTDRKTQIV